MTGKPRKHHFIPQFWIKRFAGADGRLWSYDHNNGRVSERSSKQIMQILNLYTVEPSYSDDVTLETVDLNKIDNDGNLVFDNILGGDLSESTRHDFASFLSAQILRDPSVVTTYNQRAQEITLNLLEVFDSPDFGTFCAKWDAQFPGTHVTELEFDHIRSKGLKNAENALELIINGLDASEGLPELPFTDAVRSPDGRKIIRDRLLGFDWTLKVDKENRFILGDAGVLYNRGTMQNVSVPLSCGAALFLTESKHPRPSISFALTADHEATNLNLESAARSRRWIVGGERDRVEALASQVGSNPLPEHTDI